MLPVWPRLHWNPMHCSTFAFSSNLSFSCSTPQFLPPSVLYIDNNVHLRSRKYQSQQILWGNNNNNIHILQSWICHILCSVFFSPWKFQVAQPPSDSISSLSFSPKANFLVATSWDNQVSSSRSFNFFLLLLLSKIKTWLETLNVKPCF